MCRPGWLAPGAEQVQLYDATGRPAGIATRQQMRADNLTHAATAVVLRDRLGRVHVHRRTDTKDVYPGRFDFAAGGVVAAGEEPAAAAVRELAEELGVTGVPLTDVGGGRWVGSDIEVVGRVFVARHDGPFTFADGEVLQAMFLPWDEVDALLQRESMCPDSVELALPLVRSAVGR